MPLGVGVNPAVTMDVGTSLVSRGAMVHAMTFASEQMQRTLVMSHVNRTSSYGCVRHAAWRWVRRGLV
jgi:hypothetical protein